ncbi:MAG: hypothetical protein ABIZ80_03645 [Bryobacteraceae bacterium]
MGILDGALQGLQRAQEAVEKSANRIAQLPLSIEQGGPDEVSLSDEAVALLQAKTAFEASAKVLHTEAAIEKHLIDVHF